MSSSNIPPWGLIISPASTTSTRQPKILMLHKILLSSLGQVKLQNQSQISNPNSRYPIRIIRTPSLLLGNSHIELLHPSPGSFNIYGVRSLAHSPLQNFDALAELAVFLDEFFAQSFQLDDVILDLALGHCLGDFYGGYILEECNLQRCSNVEY